MLLFRKAGSNASNQKPQNNLINKSQTENEYLPTISYDRNTTTNLVTIPTFSSKNNRYALDLKDSPIKEINTNLNLNTSVREGGTITPKIITNLNDMKTNKNQFYAKVILQNVPSHNDIIYLLENYLTENNYKIYYETSYEKDKIIFTFHEEKIAFDFTKLIYNEKNRKSSYKDIIVHLSLSPNQIYIKKNMENKRRGLSHESIMKLFNGDSYVKRIKPEPKIYGNINFGIKCPFFNVNDKKIKLNKNKNNKSFSDKNLFNKNNSTSGQGDVYGYVGYDGKPLKNYEKLRINVLTTHYKPISSSFVFREDNKNRWVSPSNFKMY